MMQGIQPYETMLYAAFFEDAAETRWNIFFTMVQQLYQEVQDQGRSPFYERCLSCYHNGITPANVKIHRAGWFSRNALNIIFGVNYLLMGQDPAQLRSVMTAQFGSLNNLLRDSQAQQDARYASIFRDAQKRYEEIRAHHSRSIPVQADHTVQNAASPETDFSRQDTKQLEMREHIPENADRPNTITGSANIAKWKESEEKEPAAQNDCNRPAPEPDTPSDASTHPPMETPVSEVPIPETSDTQSDSADCIPALLLPVLSANQTALHNAIRTQKQLHDEISKLISQLSRPFSPGAMLQRQQLSALDGLMAYLEECNRILLSTLSSMESALGTAQWQGFVEIAALFDTFFTNYKDPESRRSNAMWGDIRAIRQKYSNQLRRQGIEAIVPQPGDPFDEELHELSDDSDVDIDDAARITALQSCGYRMDDTVFLRAVVDADEAAPDR